MVHIIGDIHFKVNNEKETNLLTQQLVTFPGPFVLLGDVCDNVKQWHLVQLRVVEMIRKLAQISQVVILIGNHDLLDQRQPQKGHVFSAVAHMHNVTVIDKVTIVTLSGWKWLMVPYQPDGEFSKAIENHTTSFDLVCAHQSFEQGRIHPEVYTLSVRCFTGHIHTASTAGLVTFVGAAMPVKRDEPGPFSHVHVLNRVGDYELILSVVQPIPVVTIDLDTALTSDLDSDKEYIVSYSHLDARKFAAWRKTWFNRKITGVVNSAPQTRHIERRRWEEDVRELLSADQATIFDTFLR